MVMVGLPRWHLEKLQGWGTLRRKSISKAWESRERAPCCVQLGLNLTELEGDIDILAT